MKALAKLLATLCLLAAPVLLMAQPVNAVPIKPLWLGQLTSTGFYECGKPGAWNPVCTFPIKTTQFCDPVILLFANNFDGTVPERYLLWAITCDAAQCGTDNAIDTLELGGSAARGFEQIPHATYTQSTDIAYIPCGAGGATHVSFQPNVDGHSNIERYQGALAEIHGLCLVDDIEHSDDPVISTDHTMVATNTHGTDVIAQVFVGGADSVPSAPYVTNYTWTSHFTYSIADTDGTPPLYRSTQVATAAGSAIAWSCQ